MTFLIITALLAACAHTSMNLYESASARERAHFRKVVLPFPPGTRFKISQGAFGRWSHQDPGHEYTWDFDVPFNTTILAVEAGSVLQVWETNEGGGCDSKFTTVAQYTHVRSLAKLGDRIARGQPIAVTAKNGYLCTPQLDFTVFWDRNHTFREGHPRNIPLLFVGLSDGGLAHEGFEGVVP